MAAGVWSVRDNYLQHVAMLLLRAFLSTVCSLTGSLTALLMWAHNVRAGFLRRGGLRDSSNTRPRTIVKGIMELNIRDEHFNPPLLVVHAPDDSFVVGIHAQTLTLSDNIFNGFSCVPYQSNLGAQTLTFGKTSMWFEVGLRIRA